MVPIYGEIESVFGRKQRASKLYAVNTWLNENRKNQYVDIVSGSFERRLDK